MLVILTTGGKMFLHQTLSGKMLVTPILLKLNLG